jgi:hypothetical protein
MADRVPRHLVTRVRHGARVLVVVVGLVLALAVPAAVMAADPAATTAPASTVAPGGQGSSGTATTWVRATRSPSETVAPLLLGGVVLVILVGFIAMSFGEKAEA